MRIQILSLLLILFFTSCRFIGGLQNESPNKRIKTILNINDGGDVYFRVLLDDQVVIEDSPLGIILSQNDCDFSKGLKLVKHQKREIDETYKMKVGKSLFRRNHCNESVFTFVNRANQHIDIVFRLFNDGVAYSYRLSNKEPLSVLSELSTYHFQSVKNTWCIPYSSGDERFFEKKNPGTTLDNRILSFPILVETNTNKWALISESNVLDYPLSCGQFMGSIINYVFANEKIAKNKVSENFVSPWRVMILGEKPATIVESCLIDHLASETKVADLSWIEPGVTSFPWWGNNLANSYPDTLKKYIDLSAKMGWRFVEFDLPLIGSPGRAKSYWKTTDWIKDVVDYGLKKGVLCFGWDELSNLNTPEKRRNIFSKYNTLGIRGIKVDFVNSYTQRTRKLLEDLIHDAIQYKLMVSFHGAQSPRGFARTYPNVITFEAVKGSEYYLTINGGKGLTPEHNCILPFTRNVLGSMDYTPVAFSSKIRKTTAAHELALSVIFESGWLGMCDTPDAYLNSIAKPFLSQINATWDELIFLDGYPGEYCCFARRKGAKWFVAGINSGNERTVALKLPFMKSQHVRIYTDLSDDINSLGTMQKVINQDKLLEIKMQKNGGFCFYGE